MRYGSSEILQLKLHFTNKDNEKVKSKMFKYTKDNIDCYLET